MNRKQIIEQNEISEVDTVTLGGIPQKILVEGKSKTLPIVVCLHGGPGSPIPFSVGCRGLFPEFTNRFLMVYWDQLGCGINNYEIKSDFTIESYVKMTADLINEMHQRFPENRLFLFGVSWGSVLALKVLGRSKVDGVIIYGQILRNLFINDEVIATLEASHLAKKKMERIRTFTTNLSADDLMFLAKCIQKNTDGYINSKGEKAPMGPIIRGLLTSPDYKLRDFLAIMKNGSAGNETLWSELLKIDLTRELNEVKIPYYILQGDTDIVASTRNIAKAVEESDNFNLHCQIIKDSGHMPQKVGIDAVFETILEVTK